MWVSKKGSLNTAWGCKWGDPFTSLSQVQRFERTEYRMPELQHDPDWAKRDLLEELDRGLPFEKLQVQYQVKLLSPQGVSCSNSEDIL